MHPAASPPPRTLVSPSPQRSPPKYLAITTPANYECFSSAGKMLGTVLNTSGGVEPATAACNHRITACQTDYESTGNNDWNFGVEGGCTAQPQGRPRVMNEEKQKTRGGSMWLVTRSLIHTMMVPLPPPHTHTSSSRLDSIFFHLKMSEG